MSRLSRVLAQLSNVRGKRKLDIRVCFFSGGRFRESWEEESWLFQEETKSTTNSDISPISSVTFVDTIPPLKLTDIGDNAVTPTQISPTISSSFASSPPRTLTPRAVYANSPPSRNEEKEDVTFESESSITTTIPSSPTISMTFSKEQLEAISIVVDARRNLLLTGPGGTGKSAVIKEVKKRLEGTGKRVGITATTGAAAVAIGGTTLHSFLRLRPPTVSSSSSSSTSASSSSPSSSPSSPPQKPRYLTFARGSLYDHLRSLSCLVVDEVSMMRPDLLSQCDFVLRSARNQPYVPFGGLQVLFAGDFFQLPPIIDREYIERSMATGLSNSGGIFGGPSNNRDRNRPIYGRSANNIIGEGGGGGTPAHFVFETRLFYRLIHEVIDLDVSYRHKDARFAKLLSRVRRGHQAMTDDDKRLLLSRVNAKLPENDGINPTLMHSTNVRVWEENHRELNALQKTSTSSSLSSSDKAVNTTNKPASLMVYSCVGNIIVDGKLRRFFEAKRLLTKKCKTLRVDADLVIDKVISEITSLSTSSEDVSAAAVAAGVKGGSKGAKKQHLQSGGSEHVLQAHLQQQPLWAAPLKDQIDALKEAASKVPKHVLQKVVDDADVKKKLREALTKRMAAFITSMTGETASSEKKAKSANASSGASSENRSGDDNEEENGSLPPSPKSLQLRVGAQVMLTYNIDVDKGLVNGSRGVVEGFRALVPTSTSTLTPSSSPSSSTSTSTTAASLSKKSSTVVTRRGSLFASSSSSSSSSRSSSSSNSTDAELLPYVKFAHPTIAGEFIYRTIERQVHEYEDDGGLGRVTISQIPLRLAWASTIHKSQGMSLDRVRLSLQRIFDHGQAYVGLSRARMLEGLSIEGPLRIESITADPRVLRFYEAACGGSQSSEGEGDNGANGTGGNNEGKSRFAALKEYMLATLPLDPDEIYKR
jgi:hypothetical protein